MDEEHGKTTEDEGSLVGALFRQGAGIVRGEVDLVKAEISRALRHVAIAVVLAIFAAVLGLTAMNFGASLAVQTLVARGWDAAQATGMVAAAMGLAALACLLAGALLLRSIGFNTRRDRRRGRRR
ncbi:phage holin family protein [Mangrovicoccus algicola]|uniref:Phage holin family protein n=1 Tax=Mangrovicoccus algicola TaxID=2771008 RepID=A0A8J6YVJ5_9RHOB|nr:phage holin family protein [Mangrovicoccus algicola]MBE3638422.1 phage holin family protein [Mangrovicoccus algicola]